MPPPSCFPLFIYSHMDLIFYDRQGNPLCYSVGYSTLYLFSGEAVAYLADDLIFTFSGVHLGRFENGWVRDRQGECVFFTGHARGGPARPDVKPCPTACAKKPLPPYAKTEWPKPPVFDRNTWSRLSGPQFFTEDPELAAFEFIYRFGARKYRLHYPQ